MKWEAAMEWSLRRARETGHRYRVYGYRVRVGGPWADAVGRA